MQCCRHFVALACCLVLVGCGSDAADKPETAAVTGTVTDGEKPVANAFVEFQPEEGRPSSGTTDENGHFTLLYSEDVEGAKIGTHKVKVTIGGVGEATSDGEEVQLSATEPVEHNIPQPVTVEAGDNDFQFDLSKQD